MTVRFGEIVFDDIVHDRDSDVVYLNVSGAQPADWRESPEGHFLRFDANGNLCGITIVGASHHVQPDGHIGVTVPTRAELELQELELAGA